MRQALIFGYNEFSLQILKHLSQSGTQTTLYVSDLSELEKAEKMGFNAREFDFSDEWSALEQEHDFSDLSIFCSLVDDANNVFLTISLRASFESVFIIALAKNQESANKLKMAGADKVLPVMQMTSNLIVDILEKPVVTDVMHELLYEQSDLQIAQVEIGRNSSLIGRRMNDLLYDKQWDVMILAIVDLEMQSSFIFTAKGYNHHIDAGDVLVVIGYTDQIERFKHEIGAHE